MTFAEFRIRLFAYKRVQQRDWEKVRFISYHAMIGSHMDPKRLPKSINSFMNLDIDKEVKHVSDAQKEAFLKAMNEYLKNK